MGACRVDGLVGGCVVDGRAVWHVNADQRRVFMTSDMARHYEWHSRRRYGTRLERCTRLWEQLKATR